MQGRWARRAPVSSGGWSACALTCADFAGVAADQVAGNLAADVHAAVGLQEWGRGQEGVR